MMSGLKNTYIDKIWSFNLGPSKQIFLVPPLPMVKRSEYEDCVCLLDLCRLQKCRDEGLLVFDFLIKIPI